MNQSQQTTESFYDRISGVYDLIADAGEHQARVAGEQLLAPAKGERILEIGFGTGNSLISVGQVLGEQGRLVGIDISPGMRQVAAKKIEAAKLAERVKLDIGDARKLPYADGSFDAAFLSFTLELFPLEDIPKVLAEIYRVLSPAGRLAVVSMATVGEGQAESMLERTYIWMHRHFPHIVDCQPIPLEQILGKSKFVIDKKQELEIWTMPVHAVLARKEKPGTDK